MPDVSSPNPYDLDWGTVTPTAFNEKDQEILHVFNFDISSKEKIDRSVIFSVGKIIWTSKNAPVNVKQKIIFDLRGQPITFIDRAKRMKKEIIEKANKIGSLNPIIIEILI